MKYAVLFVAALALAAGRTPAPELDDDDLRALKAIVANPGSDDAPALVRLQRLAPAHRDLYRKAFDAIFEHARDRDDLAVAVSAYEIFYRDARWTKHFDIESIELDFAAEWDLNAFYHPLVEGVDFPNVAVRQAVWDRAAQALLFTLEPKADRATTTFRIVNIPTNYVARLEQDGRQIAAIDEHGQASGPRVVNLGPGEIEVTVTLNGPARFAVEPE